MPSLPIPSQPALLPPAHRRARPRGSSFPRRFLPAAAAVLLALATLIAGCGGDSDGPATSSGPAPDAEATAPEVRAVHDYMRDWYLWSDRVPAADLSTLSTAEAALEALRARPIDRYSFVEQRSSAEAFQASGRTVGLGIGWATTPAGEMVLRLVQPDSPAAAAGLARGDRIVAIDGRPVAELVAAGTLSAALGPATEGLAVRLRVQRSGGAVDLPVTKASYAFRPVQNDRVIEQDGRRVGYVYLSSFIEPATPAWNEALARLAAAGARDLVVDLRDNGGGRVSVAAAVAGGLAPDGSAGQPFWRLRHNARHAASDYLVPLGDKPAGVAFERIVMLISATTCSAAEMLAFGLRPYRGGTLETVGAATCGKPVGFVPQPLGGDKLLNAVTFGGASRDADADYYSGIAPRCAATDDWRHPFGDPADPLLATALGWLRDGQCLQPSAEAATSAKSGPAGAPETMRSRQAAEADADAAIRARPWRGPLDWANLR